MQEKVEKRQREEEAEASRRRAESQIAIARAEIQKAAETERRQREIDYAEARRQVSREREAREAEHFAPLNWLRTFVEDVAPKPPQQMEEKGGGEYLRLQGRGMYERWWGWHADDPPSYLM